MWLEGDRLQVIDSALEAGRRDDVDRLLADIFQTEAGQSTVPTACLSCRRDLVRTALPHVGLFVSSCPAGHGAWMGSDVVERLRRFVDEHASVAARKRRQLKILNRLLAMLGVAVVASIVFTYPERVFVTAVEALASVYDRYVSETYWPSRGWVYKWQIPTKGSSIDVHDELLYFQRLVTLLDDGITNRLNVAGVLQTRRSPAEYESLYGIYREKQRDVLARMRKLDAPERLKPVHDHLLVATDQQIRFYRAFVDAKLRDPSVDLARMLGDPELKSTNQELHAAWDEIRRLYPGLDAETGTAIEGRLCGFDVI